MGMRLNINNEEERIYLYPSGMLDISKAESLEKTINRVITEYNGYNLIINMQHVESINSTSIRVLLTALRKLQEDNVNLYICEVGPAVKKTFEVVNLDRILPIYDQEVDVPSKREPARI